MKTNSFNQLTLITNRHLSWLAKATIQLTIILAAMTGFIITGIAQTVVTNPTSPWTVPAGVTSVKVEVWGGGGGGGAVTTGLFTTNGGGGGGGGAYNVANLAVTPGHTFTITVGTGGTAGSGSAGGTGGTTTVTGSDGTVSANGGGGGGRGNGGNGTAGAASTGGLYNGGAGGASSGNGAGGGGGAGNAGNGGAGSNTVAGTAGLGSPNIAPYAGATGAAAKTSNGAGNNGTSPGAGGSGGRANGFYTSNNGGAGAAGQVVLTYTVVLCPTITAAVVSKTDLTCFESGDGKIVVSATGGAGAYTFSKDNGATYVAGNNTPIAGQHTFTGLAANVVYEIRVKDTNNCESPIIP